VQSAFINKAEPKAPSRRNGIKPVEVEVSTEVEEVSTQLKESVERIEDKSTTKDEPIKRRKATKKPILKGVPDLDFSINRKNAKKYIPAAFFVAFWGILMIANNHYAEKVLREQISTKKEIRNLKHDYYTSNAEYSNKALQSEVAKLVAPMEIKELTTPPQKIVLVKE
jgi:hypothetical protein